MVTEPLRTRDAAVTWVAQPFLTVPFRSQWRMVIPNEADWIDRRGWVVRNRSQSHRGNSLRRWAAPHHEWGERGGIARGCPWPVGGPAASVGYVLPPLNPQRGRPTPQGAQGRRGRRAEGVHERSDAPGRRSRKAVPECSCIWP